VDPETRLFVAGEIITEVARLQELADAKLVNL